MDSENWNNFKNKFVNTYSFLNSENCKQELNDFQSKCEKLDGDDKNNTMIKTMESINTLTKEISWLDKEEQHLKQSLIYLKRKQEWDKKDESKIKTIAPANNALYDILLFMQDKIHGKTIKIVGRKLLFREYNIFPKINPEEKLCKMKKIKGLQIKIDDLLGSLKLWDSVKNGNLREGKLEENFHRFYLLCERYFLKVKNIENK